MRMVLQKPHIRAFLAVLALLVVLAMPFSAARADEDASWQDANAASAMGTDAAQASEGVELEAPVGSRVGSITLHIASTGGSGSALTGGKISLYRVAKVGSTEQGELAYDVAGGQFATSAAAANIPGMTKEQLDAQNANISKELVQQIASGNVQALQTVDIANGEARFPMVEEGLYLLVQTQLSNGERKVNAFLMSVPNADGELNVEGRPKPGAAGTGGVRQKSKSTQNTATASAPNPTQLRLRVPTTGDILIVFMPLVAVGLALVLAGTSLGRRSSHKA